MIKAEIIKGKFFIEQRTYYIYDNEDAFKKDKPSLTTSNSELFNKYKE